MGNLIEQRIQKHMTCQCGGQLCRYCAPKSAGRRAVLTQKQALMLTGRMPMLIYVAGPYSVRGQYATDVIVREVECNLQAAVDAAQELLQRGHFPFIPHTHTYGYAVRANDLSYEQYMEWDEELLKRCDAIFRFARSPGADQEYRRARECGLLLFEDIEEIPECHI